jgi:hypothetical protein
MSLENRNDKMRFPDAGIGGVQSPLAISRIDEPQLLSRTSGTRALDFQSPECRG